MKRLVGTAVSCIVMTGSAIAGPADEVNTGAARSESRADSLYKDSVALIVIGGVTLGASIGLAFQSNDISQSIANDTGPNEQWPDDIHVREMQGQRLENLATVTGVIGSAFVVTGLLFYWRSRVAESEERVTVAPMASASGAGIALGGRF